MLELAYEWGGKIKSGGQKTWILRETPYLEAILPNFQEKWGAVDPPAPLVPTPLFLLNHNRSNVILFIMVYPRLFWPKKPPSKYKHFQFPLPSLHHILLHHLNPFMGSNPNRTICNCKGFKMPKTGHLRTDNKILWPRRFLGLWTLWQQ